MNNIDRRKFLKASGLTVLPALLPVSTLLASEKTFNPTPANEPIVKFYGDGETFNAGEYLDTLQKIQTAKAIGRDSYGEGGAVADLESRFKEITGKERAIFMPTGTMANQLAISVLSGLNTKVFVQETSHVFRDEADAAQSVHQKRLIPLAKEETCFTSTQLEDALKYIDQGEVFKSGLGCVSIENPVRRTDGRMVPIEELRKISQLCRSKNLPLHLDGARIYLASAWSGVTIKEYASLFDTVYISLYKYFGASGGAILCGDKSIIDKMPHLIKVHGGTMYGNWTNAAMALHRLEGVEKRLADARKNWTAISNAVNSAGDLKISPLDNGTNIYDVKFADKVNPGKMSEILNEKFFIRLPRPNEKGEGKLSVNETVLYRDPSYIINAFSSAAKTARG